MITLNFALSLLSFGLLGIYTDLQILLYATLPGPINNMYNFTLIHHYGITAGITTLSSIASMAGICIAIGTLLSIFLIVPLIDKKGRKFVAVKVRFAIGLSSASLQLIAANLQSAEFFILAQILLGISLPIKMMVTSLMLSECSPDKHRGFATTVMAAADSSGGLLMYILCRPSLVGTADKWYIIPLTACILSILLYLITSLVPESPKWLLREGREYEAIQSTIFYHGKDADTEALIQSFRQEEMISKIDKVPIIDIWRDKTIREAFFLIFALNILLSTSPIPIENGYSVLLHTTLGLSVEQSLNLNLIISLVFFPIRFIGTIFIDRYGRRPVVFVACIIMYSKVLLMLSAQILVFIGMKSEFTAIAAITNEVLTELFSSTGVKAMTTLIIAEMVLPAARVPVAQMSMILPMSLSFPLVMLFPTLNSLFAPSFYLPMLLFQPIIFVFLYMKLPETKGLSVYEIVCDIEEDIRSRENSYLNVVRRHTMAEHTFLLPKTSMDRRRISDSTFKYQRYS